MLLAISALFGSAAAQSAGCGQNAATLDLSWFPVQSIGENSSISAYLYCAQSPFSGQQVTFFVDNSQFMSSVSTNAIGVAKLKYNTSAIGLGNHTVYAIWQGTRSAAEQLSIIKRQSFLTYNKSVTPAGTVDIIAYLAGCDNRNGRFIGRCSGLGGQPVAFYFNHNLTSTQSTNSSGIAVFALNRTPAQLTNSSILLIYAGDANDTPASAAKSVSLVTTSQPASQPSAPSSAQGVPFLASIGILVAAVLYYILQIIHTPGPAKTRRRR